MKVAWLTIEMDKVSLALMLVAMKKPTIYWFLRDLHCGQCYFFNLPSWIVLQVIERCTSMGFVWGLVTLLNLLLDNERMLEPCWCWSCIGYFFALATRVRGKCTHFYVVAGAGKCARSLGLDESKGWMTPVSFDSRQWRFLCFVCYR